MKQYLPLLVIIALLVAGCWTAGCTSSSTSTAAKATTTTFGPEMTTPVVPVFTTPGFAGSGAETGITVISDDVSGNTSRDASVSMHNACPAYQPFRCPDGYCAQTSAECTMSARVVNCSDGTIYCP